MHNAQVNIRFILTQRGCESLVHEGYKFHIKSRRQYTVYWKCHVRARSVRITTIEKSPVAIKHDQNHEAEHMNIWI